MSARVRSGVHPYLEAAADELLRQSFVGVTRAADRGGVLTPYMEAARRAREVYVASGVPDPAVRRGIYPRAPNPGRPDLHSRDSIAASSSLSGWSCWSNQRSRPVFSTASISPGRGPKVNRLRA